MDSNRFSSLLTADEEINPTTWLRGSSRSTNEGQSILSTTSRTQSRLAGRRWLKSPAEAAACPSSMQQSRFRIASYNVLAKCYAKARHFTRCKPEYLRWDVRRKALMEVVRELDADILCLQEVDNYPHFWVKELSHLGYTGCYKQRNADSQNAPKNDGCATFFRSDKFEKLCHESIEFDHVPDEGGKRPDFATHNVALLLLLRPKHVSSLDAGCICVANAHLFWDPMYEDVKLAQARALVKAAEEMVERVLVERVLETAKQQQDSDVTSAHSTHVTSATSAATPIILAGDFNSMPGSDVYKFLTQNASFRSCYVACGSPDSQHPLSPSNGGEALGNATATTATTATKAFGSVGSSSSSAASPPPPRPPPPLLLSDDPLPSPQLQQTPTGSPRQTYARTHAQPSSPQPQPTGSTSSSQLMSPEARGSAWHMRAHLSSQHMSATHATSPHLRAQQTQMLSSYGHSAPSSASSSPCLTPQKPLLPLSLGNRSLGSAVSSSTSSPSLSSSDSHRVMSSKINPNSPPFSPQHTSSSMGKLSPQHTSSMGKLLFNKPLNPDSPSFSPGGSPSRPKYMNDDGLDGRVSLHPTTPHHHHATSPHLHHLPTHLEDPVTYQPNASPHDEEDEEEYGGDGSKEEYDGSQEQSEYAVDGTNRREQGTAPGEEPLFTNYRDIFKGTLDYIFFRHQPLIEEQHERRGARLLVERCLNMISEAEAKRQGGGLPNIKHPSDHLPIAVDLLLHLPRS